MNLTGGHMDDAPRPRGWGGVEQQAEALLEHRLGPEAALGLGGELIARVLRRAHQAAEAMDGPDEARGVLHVAHCFADELAAASPGFDRQRFITAVEEGPS
jgi:hypothetical protein